MKVSEILDIHLTAYLTGGSNIDYVEDPIEDFIKAVEENLNAVPAEWGLEELKAAYDVLAKRLEAWQ